MVQFLAETQLHVLRNKKKVIILKICVKTDYLATKNVARHRRPEILPAADGKIEIKKIRGYAYLFDSSILF